MKKGIPVEFDFLNMRFAQSIIAALPERGNSSWFINFHRGCVVLGRHLEGENVIFQEDPSHHDHWHACVHYWQEQEVFQEKGPNR